MAGSPGEYAHAKPVRGVRLRVHVDQQHPLAGLGEARGQVDGSRGLAHPALLICDGVDQDSILSSVIPQAAAGSAGPRLPRERCEASPSPSCARYTHRFSAPANGSSGPIPARLRPVYREPSRLEYALGLISRPSWRPSCPRARAAGSEYSATTESAASALETTTSCASRPAVPPVVLDSRAADLDVLQSHRVRGLLDEAALLVLRLDRGDPRRTEAQAQAPAPGRPAPEPRSASRCAERTAARSRRARQSRKWKRSISSGSLMLVTLKPAPRRRSPNVLKRGDWLRRQDPLRVGLCLCQLHERSSASCPAQPSEPWRAGVAAGRSEPAAAAGPLRVRTSPVARLGPQRPIEVDQQDGDVRGRDPGDARGLAQGRRAQPAQFVLGLVGQPLERPVVEVARDGQRLGGSMAPDLGELPADVALVARLDLQLLDHLRGRRRDALAVVVGRASAAGPRTRPAAGAGVLPRLRLLQGGWSQRLEQIRRSPRSPRTWMLSSNSAYSASMRCFSSTTSSWPGVRRPSSCPSGDSRSAALSCRRRSRYSAREVNIR